MTSSQPMVTGATDVRANDADLAMVAELHEAHGEDLYDFARHLGLSDDQAADAVQEAMLRLWREIRRGVLIERPTAWLYRTVYRLAMQQHRWRRRLSMLNPRLAPSRADYAGPETSDRLSVWGSRR